MKSKKHSIHVWHYQMLIWSPLESPFQHLPTTLTNPQKVSTRECWISAAKSKKSTQNWKQSSISNSKTLIDDNPMIRNDKELQVILEQLNRAESALGSLRHDIYSQNPNMYRLMAESYVDTILQLRSEVDSYLEITENNESKTWEPWEQSQNIKLNSIAKWYAQSWIAEKQ